MKKLMLVVLLLVPTLAKADAVSIPDTLSKVVLNQGVMYAIKANSVSYTMTTDVASWKGASLVAGYSSAAKAVVGLDYDLMNLKGISIPILKYVDAHLGVLASWDNIGGRNVFDWGPVVTICQLSF